MARTCLILVVIAAWAQCACSGSATRSATGDAGTPSADLSCEIVDASTCSKPVPSYKTDIAPALNRACNSTCHAPGVGPWPLTDYPDVDDWRGVIFSDLEDCTMPPAHVSTESPPLTAPERASILNWIACGAPDN